MLRKDVVKETYDSLEMMVRCTNPEVITFCREQNWDISYFLEVIDEGDSSTDGATGCCE